MKNPNKWLTVLSWFCPDHLFEEIEGDLIQKFNRDVKLFGEKKAKRRFVWNVIRFVRPGILMRNKFSVGLNPADMIFSHFKFTTRLFLKDKFFSILNILGLALGIATGIILLLILQNDLTYDLHFANHKRIYRLGAHYQITGVDENIAFTARELGPILKEEFPEVQEIVPVKSLNHTLIKHEINGEMKSFYDEDVIHTDSTYFQVFDHDFLAGNAKTCMRYPHSVVMTASAAKKYFAGEGPINQLLIIDNISWKVTAVIEDLPENSHLKFNIILSGLSNHRDWTIDKGRPMSEAFWNPDVYMYFLASRNFSPQTFHKKWSVIDVKYFKPLGDKIAGKYTPIIEPLADIHFYSNLQDNELHGNLEYLKAFAGVGILIILLACINYMNLSTAKAVSRGTEIAIKKVVGSSKRILLLFTLGESILLSFISLAVAITLVFIVLDVTSFNQLIGKRLIPDFFHNQLLLYGSLGITLGVGCISGLYPAIYLTNIPAINALKGTFKSKKSSYTLRKILIMVQFSISIFVVTCTLFMKDQIHFVMNKELGFDSRNLLVLPIQDSLTFNHLQAIKNELLQNPKIISATSSQDVMGMGVGSSVMYGESETGMKQQGGVLVLFVGDDYLKTMGLTLMSGRDFQSGSGIDVDGAYIANESAVKSMDWGKDALGKKVHFWQGENPGRVIGVVKDFHVNSLYQGVDPMFIVKGHWTKGFFQIRLTGEQLPETIAYIKTKWSRYDTVHPFEYFFLDQRFNEQYKADQVQNKLLTILSYVCIFISLLGLLALAAFNATQRTKEIGVRKVLGASAPEIILLLSKDVIFLVILSAVLVAPVSYWIISRWMENFVYRTHFNYLLYLLVTAVILGIVFLIILFQSFKTARSNPVDSLKYE